MSAVGRRGTRLALVWSGGASVCHTAGCVVFFFFTFGWIPGVLWLTFLCREHVRAHVRSPSGHACSPGDQTQWSLSHGVRPSTWCRRLLQSAVW